MLAQHSRRQQSSVDLDPFVREEESRHLGVPGGMETGLGVGGIGGF